MADSARCAGETCIYCLGPSVSARSSSHAFPEAVFPGGPIVPAGAICDGCNHYAGTKLESILISYPLVAIPLQLMRLPGKKGKLRKRVGMFDLDADSGGVTFPIEPPEFGVDPDGVSTAKFAIHPLMDPNFDMDRFRRALHHIAFNLAALNLGLTTVLDARYDPIRRYVRAPNKGDRWTFVEVTQQLSHFIPGVGARSIDLSGAELIKLRIFNTEYYVDLLNTGRILTMRFDPNDGRGKLIGPDWSIPEPKTVPGQFYRVRIR